ncbi:MAG: hypothetical protein QM764_11910 [Chitinophagaceae bacterium]
MNHAFSFNRWLLLVSKHWSENRKKYMLGILAITGVILIWFLFNILMEPSYPMPFGTQVGTYFVGLFIVGCLYASTLFSDLSSKSRGINFLSLPASQLEKTLTALLYGVVIFFVAYTVMFYIADIIMVKIGNSVAQVYWKRNHPNGGTLTPQSVVNIFNLERGKQLPHELNMGLAFVLGYFAVQSAYLLGSVYFTRFSFIKTTVSLLVFVLFIILFVGKVMDSFMPHGGFYEGFTSYRLNQNLGEEERIIRLPEWIGSAIIFLFKYAFAPIFWITTYFRVKEKEI